MADTEGDGRMLSDHQVLDEMLTLLHAGYDSSAAGLTWTWFLMANHPMIAESVAQEAQQVLGDRPAEIDDYQRLSYTQQVVQEVLRLFPPAWILMLRQATEATQLGGYAIPRKSWIYLMPWVTHRSERWFPEPLKFDPDRFSPARVSAIPSHAYFPFGHGPHRCIGDQFAMVEMTLAVATVLQRFRIAPEPGAPAVEVEPHTAIRPRGGLVVRVEQRD